MTPIRHPTTPQESAYNRAQAKTRVVIERVFAVLKSRFRYENDTSESVTVHGTWTIWTNISLCNSDSNGLILIVIKSLHKNQMC